MAQRQAQGRFSLLQHHFSQQETIPVPAVSPPDILPDNLTPQIGTEYTGPVLLDITQRRAIPTHFDLTTYQPIPTTPDPMLDQTMPIISDIEPDQVMSTTLYTKKKRILCIIAIVMALALALVLYLIWRPASSVSSLPLVTQQNFGGTAPKASPKK